MDYYKFRNIQADTDMRSSIAKAGTGTVSKGRHGMRMCANGCCRDGHPEQTAVAAWSPPAAVA